MLMAAFRFGGQETVNRKQEKGREAPRAAHLASLQKSANGVITQRNTKRPLQTARQEKDEPETVVSV